MKRVAILLAALSVLFSLVIYSRRLQSFRINSIQSKNLTTKSYQIDINSANQNEFDNLPGIGPALAKRIIDYRKQHNGFNSAAELALVKGIGIKKFENLEQYLKPVN